MRERPDSPLHLPLMLALTFSTGIIDAIGYLGLDRVFTGNMTGNVVVLGMGLAGGNGLPVLGPLVALVGFLVGAALAGRTLRRRGAGWSSLTTVLLLAVATVMLVVGVLLLADPDPARVVALPVTGLLGLAMGTQAGTARQVGVRDVSTVVVTSTLAGLAAESWFGNGRGAQPWRRGSAVALILAGACVGALLLRVHLGLGVLVAALITVVVAVLGHRDTHRVVPAAADA
ncbi:DUF1275 domain-containing protein [Nocardioides mangrovicus]|uniref:DUF1275 domain-containing protein n=1 Tax=Nocardioides mangrovicus TaxID=2478913 RepID=A0A3L8P2B0_9ACTN|nr:YoaK family protein [Nocardioides mangrovicus]RLV49107.1 DUF1275 domain-containing protein [Nocardioides mangrovicus]